MGKKRDKRAQEIEELMLTVRHNPKKKRRREALSELGAHDEAEIAMVERALGWAVNLDSEGEPLVLDFDRGADTELSELLSLEQSTDTSNAVAEVEAFREKNWQELEAKKAEKEPEVIAEEPIVNDAAAEAELERIKETVLAKRAGRALGLKPDEVDRSDPAAVQAYNDAIRASDGPYHFLTSTAPTNDIDPQEVIYAADTVLLDPTATDGQKAKAQKSKERAEAQVSTVQFPKLAEGDEGQGSVIDAAIDDELDTLDVPRDPVTGQEFDREQMLPVTNHKPPRPLIWDPVEEKLVPHRRVTTYIDMLDDKSNISDWKLRTVLAGAVVSEGDHAEDIGLNSIDSEETILQSTARIVATYQDAQELALKKDKKGKLVHGQLAELIKLAESEFKKDLGEVAERALELGGANTRSRLGTHLHKMSEYVDAEDWAGLKAAGCTPADGRDLAAYMALMIKAGLKITDTERRVVIPEHRVTGTFDRGVLYKPEGAARSKRCILDLKTGSTMKYIFGKTATQIAEYQMGKGYDPLTHEFEDLKYDRNLGLVLHLPAGTGAAYLYEVNLAKGREGLDIVAKVDAWRKSTTEAQALRGDNPFYTLVAEASDTEKEDVPWKE